MSKSKSDKFPIPVEEKISTIEEELVPVENTKMNYYISAKFGEEIIKIGYTHLATNEENMVTVSGGKMQLLHNRMYYIPIDNESINSDNGTIKVTSDISERFDIRSVRDGFACMIPIKHNSSLKNGERICIVTI